MQCGCGKSGAGNENKEPGTTRYHHGVQFQPAEATSLPRPTAADITSCRSTKTQVNPSSALERTRHHQSNPSNVPGILGSNYL